MKRPPWGPALVVAGVGSILGVVAGLGSVQSFRALRLSDDLFSFLAGTVDGRHLTALVVVPLVCVVAYLVGTHYSHDLVWLRLGDRRAAAVLAARAGAVRGIVVWAAVMTGFLTQTVGMQARGNDVEMAVVLGSMAAQPITLGALAAGVAALRLWSRPVALLVAWFLPAFMLASLLFPPEWPVVTLPYAYLTQRFWTDGVAAVLAVVSVMISLVLGGRRLARRALPVALALTAAVGWGVLQSVAAHGYQQRAAVQLRQAYDVLTAEGISTSVFGFTLACLAPALIALGRSEGRFPAMWPLQSVRGAGISILLGRDVLRLWWLSVTCWAAALLTQLVLASPATLTDLGQSLTVAAKTLVLISFQCTLYGVAGWLARARARGPAPAVLGTVAVAATAPLVVWLPWWPAGQGAAVTTQAGWTELALRSLWLVTLIVAGTWAATRPAHLRRL